MANLNALGIGNEKIDNVDFSDMPEQRSGGMQPLPQPGSYRFRFPGWDLNAPIFDKVDTQKGARLSIQFRDAFALTIVQSPGGAHDGETLDYNFSNQEFNQARKGEPEQFVSDLDFILRDVFGEKKRPADNKGYAQALVKHAGKEFTADLEFTWRCNPNKDIYVDDGTGGSQKVEGQKGCGAGYYMGTKPGQVDKALSNPEDPNSPKIYPERITCGGKDGVPCGANVRAFPRLRRFRA